MPYQLQKSGDGYFVVDDTGKKHSDKPMPKWRATAQMRALYAAENNAKKKELSLDKMAQDIRNAIYQAVNPSIMLVPPQTPYVRDIYDTYVILEVGEDCFKVDYTYDAMDGSVVLGTPVKVEQTWTPTGKSIAKFTRKAALLKDGLPASAYLVVEDPEKVTTWHLPVKDAQGKPDHRLMGAAWASLHGGYRGQKYEGPGKTAAIAQLRKIYSSEEMPVPGEKSFSVFKQADGQYRWVTISSSAFRDRDGEIVTTRALADDVARCDTTKDYGPLRWWHVGGWTAPDGLEKWQTWKAGPGIDLGTCDFNMLHGKMLIESGTFKDAATGEAFADIAPTLEVSIAFAHPPDEPGKEKAYQNIHRFERSLMPEGFASNLLTKIAILKGESQMNIKQKLDAFLAIMQNKPDIAQQILSDAESIQKAAEAAGLETKEVTEMFAVTEEAAPVQEEVIQTPPADKQAAAPADETMMPDEIGDMTHADLATFVAEVVKQVVGKKEAEVEVKQAGRDQMLADALASIKAIGDRLASAEYTMKETQQSLLELTDARPVGIKQLQSQRPTERADNVIKEAPTGPRMDPEFMKFALGGK